MNLLSTGRNARGCLSRDKGAQAKAELAGWALPFLVPAPKLATQPLSPSALLQIPTHYVV